MLKRGIAAVFWSGLLSGLLAGATAWAKPAGLPGNPQVECDEVGDDPPMRKFSIELDINSKGITLKFGAGTVEPEMAPAIDAFLPAFVEQMLQHAADALTQPERNLNLLLGRLPQIGAQTQTPVVQPVANANERQREAEAQLLFRMAELFRTSQQFDRARICYQRVHLLAPTTRAGMLAIERLQEIEARLRGEAEEQGIPDREDPQAMDRDIRNGTRPLGLVVITY